jgi:CHAT domain-containing protein
VINLQSLKGLGADDPVISTDAQENVFLAGNQLAGAGSFDVFIPAPEEIRQVASFFIGPGLHMIQGSALQWDEFQDPRFSQAGLVHLAMPGIIDLRNPARSRLLLSDNIAENEHITLNPQDMADKNLAAELVVLSNIDFTGSSTTAFDLNTRFVAEFMQAGARSVIISLWPVGDAQAARFMTTFYQALVSGSSEGNALYQTKRKFIEESGSNDAGVWASFQLFLD